MRMTSALAGVVAACLLGAAPASAAFPGTNGRIAYQGYQNLGTVNSSGGARTPLIAESGHVFASPAWSADGTRLAFESNRDGGAFEIYVTSATGTPLTRLTNNAAEDGAPSWSPDGSRIVFYTDRENPGARSQIWAMNADGNGAASVFSSLLDDVTPAWSPDGGRIAFARGGAAAHDIWVMSAAGNPGARLTTDAADETNPDWSPDGSRIVFQRDNSLVVMNADGSGQTPLPLPSGGLRPSWSPDGALIAFDVSPDLFAVKPDGSGLAPLTTGGSTMLLSQGPAWQPIPIPGGGGPPAATDADGDHSPVPLDCNDADPRIHPGAKDTPGDRIDQDCAGGDARFKVIGRKISAITATYPAGYMTFLTMTVKNVRKGDKLLLTCKGGGCKFAKKTVKVKKNARKRSLLRYVRRMKLHKGAVVQLRVTRPATIGKVATWKVRAPKVPKITRNCIKPGAKKPSRCPR